MAKKVSHTICFHNNLQTPQPMQFSGNLVLLLLVTDISAMIPI